jgi:hypothetical protein
MSAVGQALGWVCMAISGGAFGIKRSAGPAHGQGLCSSHFDCHGAGVRGSVPCHRHRSSWLAHPCPPPKMCVAAYLAIDIGVVGSSLPTAQDVLGVGVAPAQRSLVHTPVTMLVSRHWHATVLLQINTWTLVSQRGRS